MKKVLVSAVFASLLGFQMPAVAMELSGEEVAPSQVYKASKSAVKKAMNKMGYDYTIDGDGDIKYKMEDEGWTVYVIFNETGSGRLWNLQVMSQFSTKKSRYDELLAYVNKWNYEKKFPKLSLPDNDSLRLTVNFPIEYGFNPDEFEENAVLMFERTIKQIGEDTYSMRN